MNNNLKKVKNLMQSFVGKILIRTKKGKQERVNIKRIIIGKQQVYACTLNPCRSYGEGTKIKKFFTKNS